MSKASLSLALAAMLAGLAAVPAAHAGTPSGPYAMFKYCPYTNPAVGSCVINTTHSGVFVIGNTTLPIDKPIVLQGGVENLGPSPLYQAIGAPTLSSPPAKVPGGLNLPVPAGAEGTWAGGGGGLHPDHGHHSAS